MINYSKYIFLLIIVVCFSSEYLYSELNTYRVFFKDKGNLQFYNGSELYQQTLELFSKDALKRRKKVLAEENLLTLQDAPVNQTYIERIKPYIDEVKLISRWLNYCVVLCDDDNINDIETLEFVKSVQLTSSIMKLNGFDLESKTKNLSAFDMIQIKTEDSTTFYSQTASQNNTLNIHLVHNLGISGENVKIGFIDSGFKYKEHEALRNTKIMAEYDFIQNDMITENQMFDVWNQHNHGTGVLSIVCGYKASSFIGVAPGSSVYLAKTESLSFERHIEEDRFAAATEWLESQGVDIVNASLGYDIFDSLEVSYDRTQLDGNTTIVAQFVNMASQKGVLFVVANGNKGPLPNTISSPADADSSLSVGSVLPDGIKVTDFSSRGPNYKNIIKPDLCAMGSSVYIASTDSDSSYSYSNGTSFSAPLITAVAALYLSVFPESTPYQIKQALYNSANNKYSMNNDYGRGIPDIYKAILNTGIIISPIITQNSSKFIRVFSNIIFPYDNANIEQLDNLVTLNLKFKNSTTFQAFNMHKINDEFLFVADVDKKYFNEISAFGYITAQDASNQRRMPFDNDEFFTINPDSMLVPLFYNINNLPIAITENSEIVIFPNITSNKSGTISINSSFLGEGNTEIYIYNSIGIRIYYKNIGFNNSGIIRELIDISKFPIGVYFVICKQGNSIKKSKFIIIE